MPKSGGKRQYTYYYELAPEAQRQIQGDAAPFTVCRVHHAGTKYRILRQTKPVSTDSRTSHSKSWQMKGLKKHAYYYPGKAGMPSCTVYAMPKTIVAWIDKGQTIPAASIEDAERLADIAIHEAVQKFRDQQARFGIRIDLDNGTPYKKHYGFALREDHPDIEKPLENKDWWIDKSISEIEPGFKELETDVRKNASALEQTIGIAPAIPDLLRESTDPIRASVSRIEALVQGGTTAEQTIVKLMGIIGEMLGRMNEQDKRIKELETNHKL